MRLASWSYGKAAVRVMRVDRATPRHRVSELSVRVMLEGGFEASYQSGDNGAVVATDTLKNLVNIAAREHLEAEAEPFAAALAATLLARYGQVETVRIETAETCWRRLGDAHPHAFTGDGNGTPTVSLRAGRGTAAAIRSGVAGLAMLKSTESGWTGFHRDAATTLAETDDRILATAMTASWGWDGVPPGYEAANAAIVAAMLARFAGEHSPGMQHTMFRMGEAALEAAPEIGDVAMQCPNRHYLPVALERFGLGNANQVFTPTDEPHGQIECVVAR